MIKSNRVGHVDIAKGISIILVALFHSHLRSFAPDTINSMGLFRLPLFFFLSGLFFSASLGMKAFLWKKSDALLKPYFFTLVALLVFSYLTSREHNFIYPLIGILYGNGVTIEWTPMWFLPHLFVVYCFAYLIFRFTGIQKRHLIVKGLFIALMLAIGSHWIDAFWLKDITLFGKNIELPGLPFSCDLIFISAAFFIAGTFLKEWIIDFIPNSYVFFASILIFIAVVVLTGAKIDLNKREYIDPLFATIGAMCGIYFVVCISVYVSKLKLMRIALLQYGQASLFILIFHGYIGGLAYMVLGKFGMDNPANFMIALVAFFASITLPMLIKAVVWRSDVLSLFYFPLKSNNLLYRICRAYFVSVKFPKL